MTDSCSNVKGGPTSKRLGGRVQRGRWNVRDRMPHQAEVFDTQEVFVEVLCRNRRLLRAARNEYHFGDCGVLVLLIQFVQRLPQRLHSDKESLDDCAGVPKGDNGCEWFSGIGTTCTTSEAANVLMRDD